MPSILFVCSANRFRSVIAAEWFRFLLVKNHLQSYWTVGSAGTWAKGGFPPIPQALKFAKDRELEIEHIRSQEVNGPLQAETDLIVVMTEGQREALRIDFPQVKERIYLLSEVCEGQTYDIPDPVEKLDETPEELGDEICSLITSGFERICNQAIQLSHH
jgi:protein-tyrosine-phosphatase